jgi:hypothetical protein
MAQVEHFVHTEMPASVAPRASAASAAGYA